MNAIQAIQDYIIRMLDGVKGMKVILLDSETMGILSMVFSQSEVLQKEVYLFDLITNETRENMNHLKALVFVRPTEANIGLLQNELANPKYGQYHLFFSNIISQQMLENLAQADENEVVHQVQEFFADYFAINRDTFTLNIPSCVAITEHEQRDLNNRICDGLSAVLLSLKRKPIIRYENNSPLAKRVAQEMVRRMLTEKVLFDVGNRRGGVPVLLILDRRSDPVTPLLAQWTYQAMVHELIGIKNNRVMMQNIKNNNNNNNNNPANNPPEIVLSSEQDEFFSKNVYSNFGDLALNVQTLVQELQKHSKNNQNIQTIEDMKRFIQAYPEYQKLSSHVNKHISLLEELSRMVGARNLLEVSEIEQNIVCQNDHAESARAVGEILMNPKITSNDKLRILLLYALKFEKNSNNTLPRFLGTLANYSDLDHHDVSALIKTLLRVAGTDVRVGDLFSNKSWFAKAKRGIKKGLQGATNVYTQHKPLLAEQLEDIAKGKLSDLEYPAMGSNISANDRVSDVIVFIVGGATYEEALTVHEFNISDYNIPVVLGGTTIHNSTSFLRELRGMVVH